MAAALQRRAGGLLARLARLSSSSAAQQGQQQPQIIPAEVAQLVSLRGGMAALPPDVAAAIDDAAAGANRKAVKRRGQELSYRLRAMSRSKHKGGVQPNLSEQLQQQASLRSSSHARAWEAEQPAAVRRQARGKRRQARAAALETLTRAAALPVREEAPGGGLPDAALAAMLGGEAGELVSADSAAQAATEAAAASARSSIMSSGGSLYDAPAALAYAASRLPACYAALRHALREVAERRPGWRPSSQLDFGAGPGTAVWAAQGVWPEEPLDALAVEPAGAMAWLGGEIQQRQRERYEAAMAARATRADRQQGRQPVSVAAAVGQAAAADEWSDEEEEEDEEEEVEAVVPPPKLRWMYKLPPRYREGQAGVRRYDLVTVGYVLGELRSDAERRRLVADLWDRTSGVLLLVEPGTPSGSAHIQRARRDLLELAAQQAQQAQHGGQQSQQAGQQGEAGEHAAAAGLGAHVVAPCPHDGRCPLESRSAWCHFVQRFQRTQLQRAAKATAGIQPRTYQDERFSYVAIARGPRPSAHALGAQPAVAGSLFPSFDDPQDFVNLPANLAPRKVPADARPLSMYGGSEGEEELEASDSHHELEQGQQDGSHASGSSSSDEHTHGGSSSGWESDSEGSSSSSSSEEEEESSSSGDEETSSSSSDSDDEGGEGWRAAAMDRLDGLVASAAGGHAGIDEATRRLLLQSVLAEEDEDEEGESGADLAARLEAELAAAAAELAAQHAAAQAGDHSSGRGRSGTGGSGPSSSSGHGPSSSSRHGSSHSSSASGRPGPWVLAPVSEATADLLFDGQGVDWEEQEPGAVAAARAASGGWSRVIRSPRKRSGHVVLDLCSAAPGQPEELAGAAAAGEAGPSASSAGSADVQQGQQQEGVLLRQVVSRAASQREAGGTAAYRLARRLRWGDLWPADYQARFRAEEAPSAGLGRE